jgi:hypothetical protein
MIRIEKLESYNRIWRIFKENKRPGILMPVNQRWIWRAERSGQPVSRRHRLLHNTAHAGPAAHSLPGTD